MNFLISVLINAAILIFMARIMAKVTVSGWGTALVAALLIGIFSPTIGLLLRAFLNIATLGFFVLLGLGFIIRWIAFAIVIKLVDGLMGGLKIQGFRPALLLSAIMALVGSLIHQLIY